MTKQPKKSSDSDYYPPDIERLALINSWIAKVEAMELEIEQRECLKDRLEKAKFNGIVPHDLVQSLESMCCGNVAYAST